MNKKTKILLTASVLAALKSLDALAHMEPKTGDGTEKCYGVAKAHKNDCASKAGKHTCAGMAKTDNSPNDWVKVPQGLCNKLVSGMVKAEGE